MAFRLNIVICTLIAALAQCHSQSNQAFSAARITDAQRVLAGETTLGSPVQKVQGCRLSVVGAGYGGVYFAFRLVEDEGRFKAGEVCIFEASKHRIGGRVYTVRNLPTDPLLTVDVGAYRYPKKHRLIAALIEKRLELNNTCYSPVSCSQNRMKIVDESGLNHLGYATGIEKMIQILVNGGARIFYGYRLERIADVREETLRSIWVQTQPRPVELKFENGGSAITHQLMLNIPSEAISVLHQDSILFTKATHLSYAGYGTPTIRSTAKIYVQYKDAWWITKLGLLEGDIRDDTVDPKLWGRYHDGPIRCFDSSGRQIPLTSNKTEFARCNGLLLVSYFITAGPTYDKFYAGYESSEDPLTIIGRNDERNRSELLTAVHNRLMEFHAQQFADAGYNTSSIEPPEYLYMGSWRESNTLASGIHNWPRYLPGSDYSKMVRAMLRPVPGYDIFIANEAYSVIPGWAEGSITMAERVLAFEMAVGKPSWLDNQTYYSFTVSNLEYFREDARPDYNIPISGPKQ